jgi:hypothetical protein
LLVNRDITPTALLRYHTLTAYIDLPTVPAYHTSTP